MRVAPISSVNYNQKSKVNSQPQFGLVTKNLNCVIEGEEAEKLIKGFFKPAEDSNHISSMLSLNPLFDSILEFKNTSGVEITYHKPGRHTDPEQIHIKDTNGDHIGITQSEENDNWFHQLRSILFSKVPENTLMNLFS